MKFLYLFINIISVSIPIIFSFHHKLKFYKNWRAFFLANLIVTSIFILFDILFTQLGIWGFNPDYVSGIFIYNLPVEEILFFICIPFACVFTYHCLGLFFRFLWGKRAEEVFVIFLSTILLIAGLFNYNKLYTTSTFISLSILLLILKYFIKVAWLGKFFVVYLVLLIPFLLVNGVLTGSGLEQPIVWYNGKENLGIRLLTIPVEDIFYGMELILLNVFFYERFKLKFQNVSKT